MPQQEQLRLGGRAPRTVGEWYPVLLRYLPFLSFHLPETWDYAADLIPPWLLEWEDMPPEKQDPFGNLTRRRHCH